MTRLLDNTIVFFYVERKICHQKLKMSAIDYVIEVKTLKTLTRL